MRHGKVTGTVPSTTPEGARVQITDHPEVDVDLAANAVQCLEDGQTFCLDGQEYDERTTLCPYDPGHWVQPLHITDTVPDGVSQEIARDFYNYGTKRYEFPLDPDS